MIDWSTTAFLFPGQGSQQVGMGAEIAQQFEVSQAVFAKADEVFEVPFSTLLFEGPADELNMTYNTQPSMFVTSLAVLAAMRQVLGEDIRPAMIAGHSLGEITGLVVAESIDYEAGLRLVRERARLMGVAGEKSPGAMAAIIGLDVAKLSDVCKAATDAIQKPLVVANDNCPGQVVISGDREALEYALPLAKEAGARKIIPIPVSVAAHSPLMDESAQVFSNTILAATEIRDPKIPIIGNASGDFLTDADIIRHELSIQITAPVRWTETIRRMLDNGVTTFLEIGSKSVLTGLLRRIDRSAKGIVIEKSQDIYDLQA